MTEAVAKRGSNPSVQTSPNFGELVEDALLQAKNLVQAELSLAKREVTSEVHEALGSLVVLFVGTMFLQAALVTLGVLLVLALGVSLASGAVVVVLAAVGLTCALVAVRGLGKRKLSRTSARLALDAQQVLESVK